MGDVLTTITRSQPAVTLLNAGNNGHTAREYMKSALSILLVLLLVSCETTMTNDDWPEHDGKLVIIARLQLTTDSVFVFCRVSRTMGLGEKFSREGAMVNDAEVAILNDGNTLKVPFGYRQDRDFSLINANYCVGFTRSSSAEYTLTVRKGELYARSMLSIPDLPLTMDSLVVSPGFFSPPYAAYELLYVLQTPINHSRYHITVEELRDDSNWYVVVGPWYAQIFLWDVWLNPTAGAFGYLGNTNSIKARYSLTARSPEFRNYVNSRWGPNYSGSPFEPDAKNPPFNITGDGIGFFWYDLVGDPVEFDY